MSKFKKIKEKLEKEKERIEKELSKFAKKDEKVKGDWDTFFPKWNSETEGVSLEKAADEVEEYTNLLAVEYTLETKLRDINLALEKIKKDKYGICERCGKKIAKERLNVYPEAKFCLKCP